MDNKWNNKLTMHEWRKLNVQRDAKLKKGNGRKRENWNGRKLNRRKKTTEYMKWKEMERFWKYYSTTLKSKSLMLFSSSFVYWLTHIIQTRYKRYSGHMSGYMNNRGRWRGEHIQGSCNTWHGKLTPSITDKSDVNEPLPDDAQLSVSYFTPDVSLLV